MFTRASRLGDDIDDFCVKCKRIMNHAVVSLLGDNPAKVRCRTCYSDHDYRHEQAPPPKVDPRKAALFNQVLEKVTGQPADFDALDHPEEQEPEEHDAEVEPVAVAPEAAEVPAPAVTPKTRKKAKA
jgi:hypothetical protein